ncbi:glycosyltransferase [Mesomycoplasma lagogenitalium]|uniref:Glycosyltransferase n=1 Tax=Mesomycoplasma lagogenitalium TaxID=171286 RepID=A0ABY8LTN8_9BACT|nr:glycosyltransferase [Mesomycoplasma lagogenitalium]WGI36605.1 glycosyltransferase [Mesomycoplasma lagogenitalium]
MKIMIFTCHFFPTIGGSDIAITNFAKSLVNLGHQVKVFTPKVSEGENYKSLPFEVYNVKTKNFFNFITVSDKIDVKLKNEIDKFNPDIISCHGSVYSIKLAQNVSKKFNIPLVITQHTKNYLPILEIFKFHKLSSLVYKREIRILNKSKYFTLVSKSLEDEMVKFNFKHKAKIIRNGLNIEIAKNQEIDRLKLKFKKENNIEDENIKILSFLGRIHKYKNIEFIFNVLKILKNKKFNFRFILAGGGPDFDYFKNLAIKLEIDNLIIYTGVVKNQELKKEILAASDLFVFPSIFDNDPLVVGEAASFKVPAITLENTGPSERFVDNKTGFIAKNDPELFANKIIEIFSDLKTYNNVKENCYKVFESWDEETQKYVNFFQKIIDYEKNK